MQVCQAFHIGFRGVLTLVNTKVYPTGRDFVCHNDGPLIPRPMMLELKSLMVAGPFRPFDKFGPFSKLRHLRLDNSVTPWTLSHYLANFEPCDLEELDFTPSRNFINTRKDLEDIVTLLTTFPRLTKITVRNPDGHNNNWLVLILECQSQYVVKVVRGWAPFNEQPWWMFIQGQWAPAPPERVFPISDDILATFRLEGPFGASVTLSLAGYSDFKVPLCSYLVEYGDVFIVQARFIPTQRPRYTLWPFPHGDKMSPPDLVDKREAIRKRFEQNAEVLSLVADYKTKAGVQ